MALYKAIGYLKRTRKPTESQVFHSRDGAMEAGLELVRSGKYKVVTLLRDSQGEDHPSNAGQFFLDRILK